MFTIPYSLFVLFISAKTLSLGARQLLSLGDLHLASVEPPLRLENESKEPSKRKQLFGKSFLVLAGSQDPSTHQTQPRTFNTGLRLNGTSTIQIIQIIQQNHQIQWCIVVPCGTPWHPESTAAEALQTHPVALEEQLPLRWTQRPRSQPKVLKEVEEIEVLGFKEVKEKKSIFYLLKTLNLEAEESQNFRGTETVWAFFPFSKSIFHF